MLNDAGTGTMGPDLNKPQNPTRYMTPDGLHALIRDPKSVRSWPTMQMPGFAATQLSDPEIDQATEAKTPGTPGRARSKP